MFKWKKVSKKIDDLNQTENQFYSDWKKDREEFRKESEEIKEGFREILRLIRECKELAETWEVNK